MMFAAQPARIVARTGTGPFSVGGFNPTGWGAGVLHHRRSQMRPIDALARLATPADVARLVGLSDREALRPTDASPGRASCLKARRPRRRSRTSSAAGSTRASPSSPSAPTRSTAYADDLAFSFKSEPSLGIGRFAWWVDQICHQEGFFENTAKRRVLRRSTQQRLTGLVVNDKLNVPREERRRFRALLDRCRKQGVSVETVGHPDPGAYLSGFAAYLAMVQPEAGARALAEVRALLERG